MKLLTTVIGSFPKPDYLPLPDWFNSPTHHTNIEYDNYIETIDNVDLENKINKARQDIINEQINLGLDIITDGEITRDNYIYGLCRNINGIDFKTLTEKTMRNGVYNMECPTITSKLSIIKPYLYKEWLKATKISSKRVKITLPGPITIVDTISDLYYNSEEDICVDLVKIINEEILKLVEVGCKDIQIDEPVFARYPDKAIKYGIDNLNKCFENVPDDVEKLVHMCCGYPEYLDQKDYRKADPKIYTLLAPYIERSVVNTVSLEDAHCHLDLSFIEIFKNTKVILGCIDISNSRIESVNEIRERINEALKYTSHKNLIIGPDCGLGMLPKDILIKKVKNMVKASNI